MCELLELMEYLENISASNSTDYECFISQFDALQFKIVVAVRFIVALLSLVCALCVIFVNISLKKFNYFPQRLVLYLAIADVLRSVSLLLGRFHFLDERELIEPHCTYFGGFSDLYSSWIELTALFCIIANLFCSTIFGLDFSKLKHYPLLFILLLPLLWSWIPYTLSAFGIQGPWCGIRIHTAECEYYPPGNWLRFILWELPLFGFFLFGFLVTIISIGAKMLKEYKKWEGHRFDPQKQEAKQKVLRSICPLLFYPLVYILMMIPHLIGDIYQAAKSEEELLPVWTLDAVFTPSAGTVMVLLYTFDSKTRLNLKKRSLRQICLSFSKNFPKCSCRHEQDTVNNYYCEAENRFGDSLSGEYRRQSMYMQHKIKTMKMSAPPIPDNLGPTEPCL